MESANLNESLADIPLKDSEIRLLLERLAMSSASESKPTLGAVAEASGAPLEVLAQHLAAIRGKNDPKLAKQVELLRQTLSEHADRLDLLEGRTPPLLPPSFAEDEEEEEEAFAAASDRPERDWVILISVIAFVALLAFSTYLITMRP